MNYFSLSLLLIFLVLFSTLPEKNLKNQLYFIAFGFLFCVLCLLKCDIGLSMLKSKLLLQYDQVGIFCYGVPIGYGVILSGILGFILSLLRYGTITKK